MSRIIQIIIATINPDLTFLIIIMKAINMIMSNKKNTGSENSYIKATSKALKAPSNVANPQAIAKV